MGDTNMSQALTEDEHEETMKAYDALYGDLTPPNETKTIEGSGDSVEDPDCTIDDAQKAQFQAKYGDEMYYHPNQQRLSSLST